MKANRFTTLMIIAIFTMLASCQTPYRMTTTINPDGSLQRKIYSPYDEFFFLPDSIIWELSNDSAKIGVFETVVSRKFASVNNLTEGLEYDKSMQPIIAPEENLKKHFRWFYTYYKFMAYYKNISDKIPVSISNYLDETQQKLWLNGDFSAHQGLSGWRLKEEMDKIESKFYNWLGQNIYKENFKVIQQIDGQSGNSPYYPKLAVTKDSLFIVIYKSTDNYDIIDDFSAKNICHILDLHFNTNHFSMLYTDNEAAMTNTHVNKIIELASILIEYELIMPGKIIETNAPINNHDTLVWHVDALRFISQDFQITAQSRTPNYWAFVVTILLIVCSVFCLRKAYRTRVIK